MQGVQSQLNSLKGHLKDVVSAREAYEQEIHRLKGDLTTMTQENQVELQPGSICIVIFFIPASQGCT